VTVTGITEADRECAQAVYKELTTAERRALHVAEHREAAVREALDAYKIEVTKDYAPLADDVCAASVSGGRLIEAIVYEVIAGGGIGPAKLLLQEHVDGITRETLDAQARRVFAELCSWCAAGHAVISDSAWRDLHHRIDDEDENPVVTCWASDMRKLLDPTGRLAEPQSKKNSQ
jgi:hypothetical protein